MNAPSSEEHPTFENSFRLGLNGNQSGLMRFGRPEEIAGGIGERRQRERDVAASAISVDKIDGTHVITMDFCSRLFSGIAAWT